MEKRKRTRREGTIIRHRKAIAFYDKIVKDHPYSSDMSKSYFYQQVSDETGYEYATVIKIINARREYL